MPITNLGFADFIMPAGRGEAGGGSNYSIRIDPDQIWNTRNSKSINLDDIQDCYYLIYRNLIKNKPEKKDFYTTLLRLNKEDYKATVLQIETGEQDD